MHLLPVDHTFNGRIRTRGTKKEMGQACQHQVGVKRRRPYIFLYMHIRLHAMW